MLSASPLSAAVIVVNSTAGRSTPPGATTCNTGFLNAAGEVECTFLAAIAVASLTPATRDDIGFDIPTSDPGYDAVNGWWTIGTIGAQQGLGTTPIRINGYTQPGAQHNTLPVGSDAVLRIQIRSTLYVYGSDVEIRGLALHRIRLLGAQRAVIAGNFIGTNPSGTAAQVPGSLETGIDVTSHTTSTPGAADCLIGGPNPEDRNVISGHRYGIYAQVSSPNPPARNIYENNYIGLNAAGDATIANTLGVYVDGFDETIRGNVISGNGAGLTINNTARDAIAEDNLIGTSADGTKPLGNVGVGINVNPGHNHGVHRIRRNRIANNYKGVQVYTGVSAEGVEILSNEIYDNPQGGIDQSPRETPRPVITGVSADGIRDTVVSGTLTSTPSTPYRIQLFASERCNAFSGRGGQLLFGSTAFTTDLNGFTSFIIIAHPAPSTHGILTLTATNDSTHTTSEFSGCVLAGVDPLFDVVKTHAPEPVAVGGLLTYTIVAANRFPQDQLGVQFEDELPAGVTFLSATTSTQGTCSETGGTVTCYVGTVAAGGTAEVEIRVQPDAVGTLVNTARVANSTSDEDIADVVLVPPNATADFTVSLAGSNANLGPGSRFDYIVNARNLGPDPAEAEVEFHLPPGIAADPNEAWAATSGSYNPNTGIWTTDILIPDSAGLLPEELVIPAMVGAQASGCIDASGIVRPADPTTSDPNEFNDTATTRVGAGGCFDLVATIHFIDGCWGILSDDEIDFYGIVTNDGPNTATGVVGTWRVIEGYSVYCGVDPSCNVEQSACSVASPCQLAPGQSMRSVVEDDQDCDDDPFERVFTVSAGVTDTNPFNDEYPVSIEASSIACFIATAAYGSPFDLHVQALRDFRDRHLVTNSLGRLFVSTYYRLSPPIAAVIAQRPFLRGAVRTALTPIVYMIESPAAAFGILAASIGAVLGLRYALRRKRGSNRGLDLRWGHLAVVTWVLVALTSEAWAATARVKPPRSTASPEAVTATSVVTRPGSSLEDLAAASDLVVVAEVIAAASKASGGTELTVHVEEFLKGDHPTEEILVRANPSRLAPGDRAILFLRPALRVNARMLPDSEIAPRPGRPGRFILTEPGRYIVLAPTLSAAAEEALKGTIRHQVVQQAGGPAAAQWGVASPARFAGASVAMRAASQSPARRGRLQFSQVRRILKGDPGLRSDAMQVRSDLLASLAQSPESFALDAQMVDSLRDLAERLAVEATPEMQDALSSAMESIEAIEGETLDAAQIDEAREFLTMLPAFVFGGR